MKKNISINISGIIFHIEEDGYDTLRKYLDTVNRYFSSFEDSSEILADIESRIAEIFLSKLNEGKQVITSEDVNGLIATMGSVNDFKAAEESEFAAGESKQESRKEQSYISPPKKLFRDRKRKILGGVCAGLAHYFNVDPIWPRLLFALLGLGSYGGLFVVYVILWIVLPASEELEDDTIKKMFRDKEKRVVAGVASGVAAFFGVDVALVRILFVISGIFGIGLIVYIVLWIALPQANTITEKMQMQGEPVTLSNIETSVKKGMNEKEGQEENLITKIILFPFRAIAAILNGLVKILGPIFRVAVDILRVLIGLFIAMIGAGFVLGVLFLGGMAIGFVSTSSPIWGDANLMDLNLPLEAIRNTFSSWLVLFAFIALVVPSVFILLLGASVISKRIIFNPLLGWSMFVLFFISALVLSFGIPKIIYSFKEDGEYKIDKTFSAEGKTPFFRINEVGLDDYPGTSINFRGHDSKEIKMVLHFEARGATRALATENAKTVDYNIIQTDSVITFDSNITFKKDAKFSGQDLNVDIFMPYNQPFVVEKNLRHIIDNWVINSNVNESYNTDQTWIMTEKGLTCSSCPPPDEEFESIRDFNKIDLSGLFDARIQQGGNFSIEIENPENQADYIHKEGETLIVDYSSLNNPLTGKIPVGKRIKITITLPDLERLEFSGAGKIDIKGFDENDMEVSLDGAIVAEGDFSAQNLELNISGASSLDLRGRGNFVDASVDGASELSAYNYEANHVIVEANGTSSAKVNAAMKLETSTTLTSTISHRGDPQEIVTKD
jgi:phage shock protein PspC (stress-responsive transcriptional regulator)